MGVFAKSDLSFSVINHILVMKLRLRPRHHSLRKPIDTPRFLEEAKWAKDMAKDISVPFSYVKDPSATSSGGAQPWQNVFGAHVSTASIRGGCFTSFSQKLQNRR